MRTVKRNPFLSGVCAMLGGVFLWAGTAAADVTSDEAAGIVVFPKILVNDDIGVDTLIQLSNTSEEQVYVQCFYVNANSHCTNVPERVCNTNDDCSLDVVTLGAGGGATLPGGFCLPGWLEVDFAFQLTPRQPIAWIASEGLPFFPLDGIEKVGVDGLFNADSAIPPVSEDPFMGELKCIQVGPDGTPIDRNDLKGELTIVTANMELLDARGCNAVGIQAVEGAEGHGDNELVLGEEYNSCPNILILDHFFDDAVEPINSDVVRTHLTIVPCTEDFEIQDLGLFNITVQYLIFNEFEQRFSASRPVRCFSEIPLSDIDTRPRSLTDTDPASTGDLRSIFNINVQGTLTGQTRIRGVHPREDAPEGVGFGIIAVAEEFHRSDVDDLSSTVASACFNVHQSGVREHPDFIRIP